MEWSKLKQKTPPKRILAPEEQEMAAWTAEAMTLPTDVEVKGQLRASALPICFHYMQVCKGQTETLPGQGEFYTATGTALHELLQRRFPNTIKGTQVWGNWHCETCKTEHKACLRPQSCQKCRGKTLQYGEIEVFYKGQIGMHVDMLFLRPNGRFWLLDWKTCGDHMLNSGAQYLPYAKNLNQIESYPVGLWDQLKIRVERVFLTYLSRSEPETDPLKPKNQTFGITITKQRFLRRKQQLDGIIAAQQAFERFKTARTTANLRAFDKTRPCHNFEDYADRDYGMRAGFKYLYEDRNCPFANEQGCFTTGLSEISRLVARKLKNESL